MKRSRSLVSPAKEEVLRVLQSKEQTKVFYDRISGVYDLLSERSEAPMRNEGLALLNVRAGERVLGIGFGTGHGLAAMARAAGRRGQVLGLDLSERMVRLARANLKKAGVLERVKL